MAALKSIAGRSMSELVENHLSSAKNATAVTVLARIALSMVEKKAMNDACPECGLKMIREERIADVDVDRCTACDFEEPVCHNGCAL